LILHPANQVTAVRAVLVVFIAAYVLAPASAENSWHVVAAAVTATALDGVDGWLARRTGNVTAFGARFDMETDAAMILALSVIAYGYGKAGAWVLASGLLRYAFVAAAWAFPWMNAALPPSRRRQAVCVVQVVGLTIVVAPFVHPPASAAIAAAALVALTWSFFVDTLWLNRHAH
jgi:phosphatidylglycerophosphate synthase